MFVDDKYADIMCTWYAETSKSIILLFSVFTRMLDASIKSFCQEIYSFRKHILKSRNEFFTSHGVCISLIVESNIYLNYRNRFCS
jgi:hypothetical protein